MKKPLIRYREAGEASLFVIYGVEWQRMFDFKIDPTEC